MSDLDLSFQATFDSGQVEAGAQRSAAAVDQMTAAEKRNNAEADKSATASRNAATAEKERAAAIDQVRTAIDPTYAAQKRMNDLLAKARQLNADKILSDKELIAVEKLHAQALKNGATSAAAARASYTNLGFQISDITQTLAMGINPMVVFGQQAGQTAAAMAGMGGAVGRVGAYLSGPWGSIVLGAITVLGLLATKFLESGDAADEATGSSFNFANGLDVLALSAKNATAAMAQLVEETRAAIAVQGTFLRAKALAARTSSNDINGQIGNLQTELAGLKNDSGFSRFLPFGGNTSRIREINEELARLRPLAIQAATAVSNADAAMAQQSVLERLDKRTKILGDYTRGVEDLQKQYDKSQARGADPLAGDFIDKKGYEAEFERLTRLKNAQEEAVKAEEAADRKRNPKGGGKSGAAEQRRIANEVKRTQEFGDKAAESIQRINEAFNEQPSMVDKADQATRALDKTIADLEKRRPPNFRQLIDEANAAKAVVTDSLVRPFEKLREESERRIQINKLISVGREEEAAQLQAIWQMESRIGTLTEDRKQEIREIVSAEHAVTEELERRQEIQNAYLEATRSVRSELESVIAGTGKLSNFKQIFRNLQSKVITEQLFGGVFRDLEKYVKEETGIKPSVDKLVTENTRAGTSAGKLADSLDVAAARIAAGGGPVGAGGIGSVVLDATTGGGSPAEKTADGINEIVVNGVKAKSGIMAITPKQYFDGMVRAITDPLTASLDKTFGTSFFSALSGIISGALQGGVTGGIPGAILGGLKGFVTDFGPKVFGDKFSGIVGEKLDAGLKGAATGTMAAGIMKSLGIKTSTTGAQVGGAIGGMLPIPGGDIIGSILGGIVGGLFKKAKTGKVDLNVVDGQLVAGAAYGSSAKMRAGATQAADSVVSTLNDIAKQLGGVANGMVSVSIGMRDGKYRVDPTGQGNTKKKKGAIDFGDDAEAALAYAVMDAIKDGVITGLTPAVAKALQSSPDLNKALSEALAVSDLEKRLKYMGREWMGALDDFERVAAERVRLAKAYGLDLLAVEKLNAQERQKIVDDAIRSQVGSLRDLLNDLKYGSLFEGTPAERRKQLLAEIADAKADVDAGVEGSTDRLASLERQLVETSKEAYGTAGTEYAADRKQAIATAERIIAAEEARIRQAAEQAAESVGLANETNDYLNTMTTQLDQLIVLNGGTAVVPRPPATNYANNPNFVDYREPSKKY